MTLQHFNAIKQNTQRHMEKQLYYSKHVGYPLAEYCYTSEYHSISIEDGEGDIQGVLHELADLSKRYDLKVSGSTKAVGRYDHFSAVHFTYTEKVLRDYIEPEQVTKEMRGWVRGKLGLSKWGELNCRVMDLFKKGIIDWDEVVKAHKGSCNL